MGGSTSKLASSNARKAAQVSKNKKAPFEVSNAIGDWSERPVEDLRPENINALKNFYVKTTNLRVNENSSAYDVRRMRQKQTNDLDDRLTIDKYLFQLSKAMFPLNEQDKDVSPSMKSKIRETAEFYNLYEITGSKIETNMTGRSSQKILYGSWAGAKRPLNVKEKDAEFLLKKRKEYIQEKDLAKSNFR